MIGFWIILGSILLGNVVWWAWADRRLRPLPGAFAWRLLLAGFIVSQFAYLAAFLLAPTWSRQSHQFIAPELLGVVYLWAVVVLPTTFVILLVTKAVALPVRWIARSRDRQGVESVVSETSLPDDRNSQARDSASDAAARPALSRRQLLAAAAVAVPPLITGVGVAYGRHSLYDIHVKRIEMPIANLPRDLDGLTIAHLTDVHVGKFVDGAYLARVREMTNALHADLHLLTGDLIDLSIADLPVALDFVTRLDPKHALVMCEGNHDLIESPKRFYDGVTKRSVPLLVNGNATVRIPGRSTPVNVLGLGWGGSGPASKPEGGFDRAVADLKSRVGERQFPILLAHHPHAFDAAADAGVPVTLAGHTHGGLLMLSERAGPASFMYRYFRGVYEKPGASLYVSNGVGSWFPVRTHARPEIAHITLRRSA